MVAGLALASLCLPAGTALAQSAPAKVKIGIDGILPEAGLFIAQERGYFAAENLNVEFIANAARTRRRSRRSRPGRLTRSAAASRPASSTPPSAASRQDGDQHQHLGGCRQQQLLPDAQERCGRGQGLEGPEGPKIASRRRSRTSTALSSSSSLALGGLTLKDVQTVEVPLSSMIVALRTGGVDAAHTSEPLSTVAVGNGSAIKWNPRRLYPGPQPLDAVVRPQPVEQDARRSASGLIAYLRGARDYAKAMATGEAKAEVIEFLIKNTPVKDRSFYDRMGMSHIEPDGVINLKHVQGDARLLPGGRRHPEDRGRGLVDDRFRQAALRNLGRTNLERRCRL